MKIALFGDVGGHLKPYSAALTKLGVDCEAITIPEDLVVIQVGDLVHKGPDSAGCVALADALLTKYPEQYYQLFGNHEGHHIGGPQFCPPMTVVPYEVDRTTEATLKRWWHDRTARMAVALAADEYGSMLVTHAGLSAYLWDYLGRGTAIRSVAKRLNNMDIDLAFIPGIMLGARLGNGGVAWAEANAELYSSWVSIDGVPFGQVHGHSSAVYWNKKQNNLSELLTDSAEIDYAKRHCKVTIGGKVFIGIDPCFGANDPWFEFQPLIVNGYIDN